MSRNKNIDWEQVEIEYRAGIKTLRMIAADAGCAESAIRKRANRDSWPRDLEVKIKQRAQELVRKAEVRKEVRSETPTEREQIEVMAVVQTNVILSHRSSIKMMNKLALSLLEELDEQTINRELYAELGEMLRSEDDKGRDKRNDLYQKIIAGSSRVDSMKKLSETLKNLIGLERQAFNIGDGQDTGGDGPKAPPPKDPIETARQIAFLLARAVNQGA